MPTKIFNIGTAVIVPDSPLVVLDRGLVHTTAEHVPYLHIQINMHSAEPFCYLQYPEIGMNGNKESIRSWLTGNRSAITKKVDGWFKDNFSTHEKTINRLASPVEEELTTDEKYFILSTFFPAFSREAFYQHINDHLKSATKTKEEMLWIIWRVIKQEENFNWKWKLLWSTGKLSDQIRTVVKQRENQPNPNTMF